MRTKKDDQVIAACIRLTAAIVEGNHVLPVPVIEKMAAAAPDGKNPLNGCTAARIGWLAHEFSTPEVSAPEVVSLEPGSCWSYDCYGHLTLAEFDRFINSPKIEAPETPANNDRVEDAARLFASVVLKARNDAFRACGIEVGDAESEKYWMLGVSPMREAMADELAERASKARESLSLDRQIEELEEELRRLKASRAGNKE